MNCHDFEKLAQALAHNSLLDATARDQGLIHTETCSRCAARLAEERALLASVRAVVAEMAGEEPPARVETALLAAFRAQAAVTASPSVIPAPSRARRWPSWKLAAVAAGILMLISAMAIFWGSGSSHKPQREERAVLPTPDASPTSPNQAEPPVGSDQVAVGQPKNLPKRVRRQASVNSSDEAEVVTRFFPLREGEDLTELDSLQLVRVELPGSALSEVGLPIDPETVKEPVIADVVLGQDGLARAIRFVR
jgi:anti-sigma factor RsiW